MNSAKVVKLHSYIRINDFFEAYYEIFRWNREQNVTIGHFHLRP